MKNLEGMRGTEIDFIPDRLIADPVVFMGMSDAEIITIGVVSVLFWMPISILLLLPFGLGVFGLGLGLALAMGTLVFAGRWLSRLKLRKPNGLHLVVLKKQLQRTGFVNYGYITRSGHWDIRRSQPVVRATAL